MSRAGSDSGAKISDFFKDKRIIKFKKGTYLIEAGVNPEYIYYLVSGEIKQIDLSPQGNELVLNVFKPGSYFPMSYPFTNQENEYFYQAYKESEVQMMPAKDVYKFVTSDKEILTDLLTRVYQGTNGLLKRVSQLMGGSSKSRLIQELIIESERQHGRPSKPVSVSLTVTELASRTGITRETASRVISVMRKKGLLDVGQSKIIINDTAALADELENEFDFQQKR